MTTRQIISVYVLLYTTPTPCLGIENKDKYYNNLNYARENTPDKSWEGGWPPPPPPDERLDAHHRQLDEKPAYSDAQSIQYSFSEMKNDEKFSEGRTMEEETYESKSSGDDNRSDALIRKYKSRKIGKMMLSLSSSGIGMIFGLFLSKSISFFPVKITTGSMLLVFLVLSLFPLHATNPYTSLVQALGVLLLMIVKEYQTVRREYPTSPHIKAIFGKGSRRPLQNVSSSKLGYLSCLALVGGVCGGNLPIIPTWIGGLAGAAIMGIGGTLQDAKGDLFRSMGMRLYALVLGAIEISGDLSLWTKLRVFGKKIFDFMMILDRKHRIKDRLQIVITWFYNRIMGMVKDATQDNDDGRKDSRSDDDGTTFSRRDDDGKKDSKSDGDRRSNRRDHDRRSDSRRDYGRRSDSRRDHDRRSDNRRSDSEREIKKGYDSDRETDRRYGSERENNRMYESTRYREEDMDGRPSRRDDNYGRQQPQERRGRYDNTQKENFFDDSEAYRENKNR